MTAFELNKIFCQIIMDDYEGIYQKVVGCNFIDGEIIISYEDKSSTFIYRNFKIDKYRYGVYLKEIIENKAHNLGLKGIWIDLNDLSKDEGCFFRHCNEVYLDLKEYENNKCCMSQLSGS